jgi:hypothetical protein
MSDDHLSGGEAAALGARLEVLCREFSPSEQAFLKLALRLAAANLWAHTTDPLPDSGIQELIVDIYQAGSAHAISLNPMPIPTTPKGPSA